VHQLPIGIQHVFPCRRFCWPCKSG